MKRLVAALLWCGALCSASSAQETFGNYVNGLPAASALGAYDQLYVRQGGISKQVTVGNLVGVPITGTPALGYVPIATGATAAAWTNSNVVNVLNHAYGSNTGMGGDDSTAINAAISAAVADGSGTVVFPTPPSGFYNVCANHVTRPSGTPNNLTLIGTGSGNGGIRILPGCASPPNEVVYDLSSNYGSLATKSAARMSIQNLRIDAYCLAPHALTINYDPGFSSFNTVYRNAKNVYDSNGYVASDILILGGYEYSIDASNRAENVNDSGHACYSVPSDFPAFNVHTYGTDSQLNLVMVGAEFAGLSQEAGGANILTGAHSWGYVSGNADGQAVSQPVVNFYLRGIAVSSSLRGDDPTVAMIRQVPVPSAGMVNTATVVSAGTGGTPGMQLLTGTTGTGTKFTAYAYVGASGSIVGPVLIWNQGNYSVNPSNLNDEPVTGGGLSGAALALVMGAGSADGYGSNITGAFVCCGLGSGVEGISLGDGIFVLNVVAGDFSQLAASTDCVVEDSSTFNTGINIQLNTNCSENTPLSAVLYNLGTAGTAGQLGFLYGGTNYITAPTGGLYQFQVNEVPVFQVYATGMNVLTASDNQAFEVDTSTANAATGLDIKSAAAGSGVAVSVLSSAMNEALTINALGTGTIGIGNVSTGAVTITPATTIAGELSLGTASIAGQVNFLDGSTNYFTSPTGGVFQFQVNSTAVANILSTGIVAVPTTAATSTSSGALRSNGGLGVAGAVYIGGTTVNVPNATGGSAAKYVCADSSGNWFAQSGAC